MQKELTADLVKIAKEKLASGQVQSVIGWRKGLFDEDITPSVFTSAEDLEKNFVFNKFCKANLSKYLVKYTRGIEIMQWQNSATPMLKMHPFLRKKCLSL